MSFLWSQNYEKLNMQGIQKQLISDLDYKHKEWSKSIESEF